MPTFKTLVAEIDANDGRIARLTLNQPDKLNPLGGQCLRELSEAAAWFDSTDATVVVVSGAGRAFSAGFDLREFGGDTEPPSREQADAGRLMAEAVGGMNAVTVASISGPCVGGGLVLATCCDLRIAADNSVFSIPEVDLGIPLAWGGIPRLLREVPPAIVRELVLTCRPFDATEAAGLGLVNRIVALDDLDVEVDALAASLAAKAPSVLRATKRHINATLDEVASTRGSWADADLLRAAMADPEARAAARRYLESRAD